MDLLGRSGIGRLTGRCGEWLLSQSHTTQSMKAPSLPRPLHEELRKLIPLQVINLVGKVRGSQKGGAIPFHQADAVKREVLDPRKMVSVVWKNDTAQRSWWLFFLLSPQNHKPQSLFR